MKCIVCERPTLMIYKKGGIGAAFCPSHIPKARKEVRKIKVTVKYWF